GRAFGGRVFAGRAFGGRVFAGRAFGGRVFRPGFIAFAFSCWLLTSPSIVAAQTALRGRVVNSLGAPMARVPVTLVTADLAVVTTTFTDDNGAFVFDRACQKCRAQAALSGFTPASVELFAGTEAKLTLAIAPVQESVVVTATRGDAPTGQLAASVTVFDAAAIERRGDALVGDLLRQGPGAAVVQTGGEGTVTSLFVRGGENSYTKVLLDGIALNEPGGAFNFGGISTGHLERVEFVRGAQSALFGSDAMAGVLQLVSRRGRAGTGPSLAGELGAGGNGTARGSASISGGNARWDYSLYGGRYETDNRDPNNGFDLNTVSLTGGGQLAQDVTMRVVGRYEDGRTGTPGQTAFGRPDLDAFFTQSHLVGGVSIEHQVTPAFKQRVSYSHARSEQQSTNLKADPPYTPSYLSPGGSGAPVRRVSPFEFYDFTFDTSSRFTRHQAGYQADLRMTHGGVLAGAEFLTMALDWDGERATLSDHLLDESIAPRRDNYGATLQHQHVSRWFALTTGVRVERNDNFGTATVPRFSAAVFLGATKLKGNFGHGIKEPSMRQSYSLSSFDLGNPNLRAERARTFDAGFEQRLFDDRVKIEAVWFDNRFENQINTRTISFSPYQAQYFNVGLTRARGTEVIIDIVPVTGLHLMGSHTFTDSEIVDASSEFSEVLSSGNWALRRPRHSGQVQALWERGRFSLDAAGTFVGQRNDSDFSALQPPITSAGGYWLWRAQAIGKITTAATAYVRVENLTNKDYMEPLGYPAWRRTVHAGLRVRF
ncbi:MAG TPA: TonB-dependent receptor, partial [Vicinamibacterales bacterium]|nr:TonB-dependent receptor [Vicinamibacterales bacterium]